MKKREIFFTKVGFSIALSFILTSNVFAGAPNPIGTMTYSIPGATAVPTLSGTMLIALSLLLFAVAFRVAKQKGSGKMFITLIGVSALSIGGSGIKLVSDAKALMGASLPLNTGPTTGEVDLYSGYNIFENTNSQTVTIKSITTDAGYSCGALAGKPQALALPAVSTCSESLEISNGNICDFQCDAIVEVSDIRLKQNIKYLRTLENGLKIYSFKYLTNVSNSKETQVGVMAQDLLNDSRYKDAVIRMKDNHFAVNYRSIGLKMITLDQWKASPDNVFYEQKL
ncbi:hypothetical protein GCM10009133_31540 [Cocleimonas flava]|uniref:Endosialidase-like protein n=1 Tax=Cocleimonas flava TaxID=634765 RepID=A0A4R1F659_9GAMM|nr:MULTISPECIES: midcut-by-XrtH protein [Cocleimonas]MEB8431318.1 midcut-by-XrtH protein [Cocleimonas sp. KMM 6892]MEC4713910.1 midcut-by-XrtH protein [Cocleimonas sp. KMM 6895]MEC4743241.1 midcut-by-XrtH protein [Cocleimonas sp. KMM 6896]TCJ89000.1 endosialidase-like protein [Cocleimonas flava]